MSLQLSESDAHRLEEGRKRGRRALQKDALRSRTRNEGPSTRHIIPKKELYGA